MENQEMLNCLNEQLEYSRAIKQRIITFNEPVSDKSIMKLILMMEKLVSFDNLVGQKEPIEIQINTNGGSVYDCLTFISYVEKLKDAGYEIITTNIGRAFSAGFTMLLCGTTRRSFRYADCMYHQLSTYDYGTHTDLKRGREQDNILMDRLHNIVCKYTKLCKEELKSLDDRNFDKFFNAEEMVKFGIVDIIV